MAKKSFSDFYDNILDKEEAKLRADLVLSKITQFNPKAKKVLELGVGNGIVLSNFPAKYSVSGLDINQEYIKLAKRRIKKARLYTKSMHDFKLKQKFDVVFSIFDSINFLETFADWKSTFKSVYSHLGNNGIFIFDMYTDKVLEKYRRYKGPLRLFSKGYLCDFGIVNENSLTWEFYVFEKLKKSKFDLHKFEFKEKIFPIGDIKSELKKYFLIMDFLQIDETRVLFVCKKSSFIITKGDKNRKNKRN